MTMDGQKFCLKWDGFQSSVTSLFDSLRQVEELVDITLCCEGHQIRAHRMMLSVCSPYFRDLLKNNPCQQMVFFLKDTSAADLSAVIEFMYKGSVNVAQTQLASFIKTAEMLQIRGLSGDDDKVAPHPPPSPRRSAPAGPTAAATPPHKRRRFSGSDGTGRRSPASPIQRPRTPTPPPAPPGPPLAPPPPPPPPQAPAAMPDMAMDPLEHHGAVMEQHAPPPPPPLPEPVKVEKIDLTEDDDDASLDSTLCHVAEYEGAYDGSNSGLDQMPLLSAAELGGLPPLGAGPSQQSRTPHGPGHGGGPAGEDGASSGFLRKICNICFKEYKHQESLMSHMKVHEGLTTCPRCEKVCGTVKDLRRHLENVHSMSQEEVRQIVPTKPRNVPHVFFFPNSQ